MDFKSLHNKNIVDGKVIMTEPTMLFIDLQDVDTIVEHVIDSDQVGRPDLIALKYYSDQSLTDILLKFNGVSNPFSLNQGDIIDVPVNQERFKKFIKPKRNNDETQKEKFLKQRRMTEKDKKRFEFLQSLAQVEALPPNRLKTGQTNKDISGVITDLNPSQS